MVKLVLLLAKGVKTIGIQVMVEVHRYTMCLQRRNGLMYGLPTHTTIIGSTTHFNLIFLLNIYLHVY